MKAVVKFFAILVCVLAVTSWTIAQAQTSDANQRKLKTSPTVLVSSELGGSMVDPLTCDQKGNLYVHLYTTERGRDEIKKIDEKGKKVATYSLSAVPNLQFSGMGYFFVGPDGTVYVDAWTYNAEYILSYASDGTFKSAKKFEAKLTPSQIAVFESGEFLISGLQPKPRERKNPEDPVPLEPFTAIFDKDLSLVKRITLEDDAELKRRAEVGDSEYSVQGIPGMTNRGVTLGHIVAGDGSVYLVRHTSPALIYEIAASGEVKHRFTVEPPTPGQMPSLVQANGRRIAILFWSNSSKEAVLKLIDKETGETVATYSGDLGSTFACYDDEKSRFTFMRTQSGKLGFFHAEP